VIRKFFIFTEYSFQADKKIYALRDVSGTVGAIPLQCSSIMSKKIAENPDALVLDVKTGSGSYNPSRESAVALATAMVSAGEAAHKPTVAFVTSMCVSFSLPSNESSRCTDSLWEGTNP
jgi:thymidine phosphorylase